MIRLRGLGMLLVGVGILLGTPIALSLALSMTAGRSTSSVEPDGYVERSWLLADGSIAYSSTTNPDGPWHGWRRSVRSAGPLAYRWSSAPLDTDISVPLWPVSAGVLAAGTLLWRRGNRELAGFFPLSRSSIVRYCVAGLTLALSSVVVLSFLADFGVRTALYTPNLNGGILILGVDKGAFFWNDQMKPDSSVPHPLKFGWDLGPDGLSASVPIWPLVPVMIIATGLMLHLRNRSRRWARAGKCFRCGYPRIPRRPCPECGH